MRNFHLTGRWNGHIALQLQDGLLAMVDFAATDLSERQRGWILRHLPLQLPQLLQWVQDHAKQQLYLVEQELQATLEDFVRQYPYKRNSHLLPDVWKRLGKTQQVQAVLAAAHYRRYCEREAHWYKPKIAATWLKTGEYLNDWKKM